MKLRLEQRRSGARDEHLPPMAGCGDPCRAMDVTPDVTLVSDERRSGVQADANPDRTRRERLRAFARCRERSRSRRKGEEEGIALSVHLDPVVAGAGLADQAPVIGEGLCVNIRSELVEKPRRTLDIGEQECDSANREVVSHAP